MSTRSMRCGRRRRFERLVEHRVERVDAFDRAAAADAARVERHEVEPVAELAGQRSRDRGEEADTGRTGTTGVEHERADAAFRVARHGARMTARSSGRAVGRRPVEGHGERAALEAVVAAVPRRVGSIRGASRPRRPAPVRAAAERAGRGARRSRPAR